MVDSTLSGKSNKEFRVCRDCGSDFKWTKESRCNPCRHIRAKAKAAAAGRVCERCDKPAIAKSLCITHYSLIQREKHGRVYPGGKRKLPARMCGVCHEPVMRVYEATDVSVHKACRELKRLADARLKKRRMFEMRIEKAAVGTTGGSRVFVQGKCAWCPKPFMAPGGVYCSDKCKVAASFKRRSNGSTFSISPKDRLRIYMRDGWTCQLCKFLVDKSLPHTDQWSASLDHIIPQSHMLIPDHSPSNLRLVHRMCNSMRGDGSNMTESEFHRRIAEHFGGVAA